VDSKNVVQNRVEPFFISKIRVEPAQPDFFFPRENRAKIAKHASQHDHSGENQEMSIRPEWCPAIWSALQKLMSEQQAEVLTTFGRTPKMMCVQYSFTKNL